MIEERLDRQLRIIGWDQIALSSGRVCVLGDDDLLASIFALSASALGINDIVLIGPHLDPVLAANAYKINPKFSLTFLEGYYTHPAMDDIFSGCGCIVDLSSYAIANKLALETAFRDHLPLVRAFIRETGNETLLRVFTYMRGREWKELDSLISAGSFPGRHSDDPVLDSIAAGIALDLVKSVLMGWKVSRELISFKTRLPDVMRPDQKVLVVGAGALGNFVGMGLAYLGIKDITFMDPDLVEVTNLNRQVLFHEAIGRGKAKTLAIRLNEKFGTSAKFHAGYFTGQTDVGTFDAVFDCVDNFESRIMISECCRRSGRVLVSGGTSATAGQAVFYDPESGGGTPAELLGLYEVVRERKGDRAGR
ncbi:MAG: ThiF family adenylyltransferase, partial [Syntrophobacteraceae bacterium]